MYKCVCVWLRVRFMVSMMELAHCRQPVLILWPSPQLQRVGYKPLSSNLQTVQQSMANYLNQSMVWPFLFLPISPSLLPLPPSSYVHPITPSLIPLLLLLIPPVSFLLSLCFFLPLLHTFLFFLSQHSLQLLTPQHLFEKRQFSSSAAITNRRVHMWNI